MKRLQIGKFLVEKKIITQDQLDAAIIHQMITGKKLGQLLIESGSIEENVFLALLSEQLECPVIDLKTYPIDLKLAKMLPEAFARRCQCILLKKDPEQYWVGMVDPQDLLALDQLEALLKWPIRVVIVRERELGPLFGLIY